MNKKSHKIRSIIMISAISIVGVFFLILGTMAYGSDMYPYDVYLSKQVELGIGDIENRYLIQGEIKNRGEENIIIEKLEFRCYNEDRTSYGVRELSNITIAPGESYSIYEEIQSDGSLQYTSVRLYKTIIEGEEVQMMFSEDGKNFGNKQNELTAIIFGAIMLVIGGFMTYKYIRRRKVLNG